MQRLFTLIFLFVCAQSFGQSPQQSQLESWTEEYWQQGLNLLTEIVQMPNDAVYTEQIETNIQWCEQQFEARDWSYE